MAKDCAKVFPVDLPYLFQAAYVECLRSIGPGGVTLFSNESQGECVRLTSNLADDLQHIDTAQILRGMLIQQFFQGRRFSSPERHLWAKLGLRRKERTLKRPDAVALLVETKGTVKSLETDFGLFAGRVALVRLKPFTGEIKGVHQMLTEKARAVLAVVEPNVTGYISLGWAAVSSFDDGIQAYLSEIGPGSGRPEAKRVLDPNAVSRFSSLYTSEACDDFGDVLQLLTRAHDVEQDARGSFLHASVALEQVVDLLFGELTKRAMRQFEAGTLPSDVARYAQKQSPFEFKFVPKLATVALAVGMPHIEDMIKEVREQRRLRARIVHGSKLQSSASSSGKLHRVVADLVQLANAKLSTAERQIFAALEVEIDSAKLQGDRTPQGRALLEIWTRRLYRERSATFSTYCKRRWGLNLGDAQKLIDEAESEQSS